MKEQLKTAMKDAMKAKDPVRLGAIRSILSEIQYDEMQKGITDASASDIIAVLQREVKKRREEIEFAEKANRPEATEKLLIEIKTVEAFLPQQMNADELKNFFSTIKQTDTAANRGTAMKALKDAHAGQYDGKLASTVTQEVFG